MAITYPALSKKFDSYLTAAHADDMRQIAAPLAEIMDIHLFAYQKLTREKELVFFTTNPGFTENVYIPNQFYENSFSGELDDYENGFYFWDSLAGTPIYDAMCSYSKRPNGITIIKKEEDACEFFFFGSNNKNASVNYALLNNLSLLQSFTHYFKKEASALLLKGDKNKIILPKNTVEKTLINDEGSSLIMTPESLSFINNKNLSDEAKNFIARLRHDELSTLSTQQLTSVQHLLEGKKIKEIAREMKLSPRTIELYLNTVKKKLNCKTLSGLLIELSKMSMLRF